MAEERITERVDGDGNVTERVIERGPPTTIVEQRGGGGFLWGLLAVIAIVFAAYLLFDKTAKSEASKDDAIERAAEKVGQGAEKVGDAAEKAADKLSGDDKK